jgi:hypothetical protein
MNLSENKLNISFLSIDCSLREVISLLFLYLAWTSTAYASGNADVVLSASSANGAWSFASSTYTWTPNANSSTVNMSDIVACLQGSNTTIGAGSGVTNSSTNGIGSVTILTACSGAGSQSGNVTTSAAINSNTATSTQLTFTITAAGSITISQVINLTPGSNGATGYPGVNLVLTGPTGVTINASGDITTTGGISTNTNAPGGAAGSITMTSSGGAVTVAKTITAKGAGGGTGSTGSSCTGGAGGALNYSGTSIAVSVACDNSGGNATGTGVGGAGGSVTFTATSTTIAITNGVTSNGGTGGTSNGAPGTGGAGGTVLYTAATNITMNTAINTTGGAGAGNGNGGVGGPITFIATAGSIAITNTVTASGGASGSSIANQSGGNGGAIIMTAGTTYSNNTGMTTSGGSNRGTGTSNGGAITLTGTTGLTISNTITSSGGSGGAGGTGGTLTINDGNTSITSGGANDGQTSASWTVGALTKTGAGNFQLGRTANTWTGATTITAGKLTLGAIDAIPDASQLVFNGGRLVMGAFSETVGTIMISAYSVLDLPSGNYTLTASASNGITWTTGKKLGINNWGVVGDNYTGTLAGGSDPKFKLGTTNDLDATHLAAIYFKRSSNGSTYTSTQTITVVTGEIVPTSTLPVKLISFSAQKNKNNDQVDVAWETASEINSDYFEILRSNENEQWESIGKVSAAGTSNKIIKYSIVDPFPAPGINYYQLTEYDFDGAHQESNVVSVSNNNKSETLVVYPNPTSSSTTFDFYSENGGIYYLKGYTNNGEEIYSAKIFGIQGENRFNFSMQDFSPGIYSFQITNNTNQPIASAKVVKTN